MRTIQYSLMTAAAFFLAEMQAAPGGQPLFDGRTFDGWEGNTDTAFRIEDGAIVGGSLKQGLPHNEFLCATREFVDFDLRLQCRLSGNTANGGVQFRSRRVPNHHEVSGYQADLAVDYWGNLYDESRRDKTLVEADKTELQKVLKPDDWNECRIRCQGRRIEIWINGLQTVDYTEPDEEMEQKGIIGVQIHGGQPSEAWYKDIIITPL